MILSRYTFLFTDDNDCYLYNSLYNSLILLDQETYDTLSHFQDTKETIHRSLFNEGTYNFLTENNLLVDNWDDEILKYRSVIQDIREQREVMNLTIAPTMDCNFNCFYCFERNRSPKYMDETTIVSIVEYVCSFPSIKQLSLTWFGGEPLMAKEQMRQFYSILRERYKGNISSRIITNGYFIDDDAIELFKTLNISSVQITLDGASKTHNSIKFCHGCSDAFGTTIQNALRLVEKLPEAHVAFRVNITKQNAGEFISLFHILYNCFGTKNFSVSPAIVKYQGHEKLDTTTYFTHKEYADYILSLFNKHNIHTPLIMYPKDNLCECTIRDKISVAFDPDGYAYKCWERIGDTASAIGKVNSDGSLVKINSKELNRDLYGADPLCSPVCSKCKYLPLCDGGCPIDRIKNEYEGCHRELCSFYKGRIPEFMKAHLLLKQKGICNRLKDVE